MQQANAKNQSKVALDGLRCYISLSLAWTFIRIVLCIIMLVFQQQLICIGVNINQKGWTFIFLIILILVDCIKVLSDMNLMKQLKRQGMRVMGTLQNRIGQGEYRNLSRIQNIQDYYDLRSLIYIYKYKYRVTRSSYHIYKMYFKFNRFLFIMTILIFGLKALTTTLQDCPLHKCSIIQLAYNTIKLALFLFIYFLVYVCQFQLQYTILQFWPGLKKNIKAINSNIKAQIAYILQSNYFYQTIYIVSIAIFAIASSLYLLFTHKGHHFFVFFTTSFTIIGVIKIMQCKCQQDFNFISLQQLKQIGFRRLGKYKGVVILSSMQLDFIRLYRVNILLMFIFLQLFFAQLSNQQVYLMLAFILISISLQIFKDCVLKQRQINYLPLKKFKNMHTARKECAICLSQYLQEQSVIILPCSDQHHLHQKCLREWVRQKKVCPLCRMNIQHYLA